MSVPIAGYREQDDARIEAVNENKRLEETVLRRLDDLFSHTSTYKRWLSVARTHIEQGFMAANRAVLKPERLRDLR